MISKCRQGRKSPRTSSCKEKTPASKATQPKQVMAMAEEDDDEVLELKDCLAAYNLESSPENQAVPQNGNAARPAKTREPRRAAPRKKPTIRLSDTSEEEADEAVSDDAYDISPGEAPAKAGRKPRVAAAVSKKRGPAKKADSKQMVLTDKLKPAESTGISPEKKVRKTRASPFHKKSSSVLQTEGPGTSEASSVRPRRASRKQTRYVVSDDSDSVKATEDSEFEEDED
ncbi:hypothetical protein MLD38_025928 [Melastoma candidum]|uniref:Uncharacterized protein n=1 Tax=Melastoma candidum TaxID=119954 RepID=A0ACB9NYR3_9MYRT|nr:hypothetical protein MLD38_025928 [Melastoma candidum]